MLFFKECKKIVCSMIFVLYVVVIGVMYVSQFVPSLDTPVTLPQPDLSYYGMIEREEPDVLVPAATQSLITEYLTGSYTAYPFLFYKEVKLSEKDSAELAGIIEELTDLTKEEMDSFEGFSAGRYENEVDENGNMSSVYREPVMPKYELAEDVTYEHFKELMVQADKLIGGGSKYSEKYLVGNFSQIPMTYEDALAEYEAMMDGANIAEVYVRLYCDYMGIILSILPVFVCVGLWQMDKKAQMEQLIFSRKTSSVKIIGARYFALVFCMAVPVALTFAHALLGVSELYQEKEISFISAIGLGIYWLFPNIMIVTAAGTLVSELVAPLFAIFVQGVWWYMALEMNELVGGISKWTLIIRHNSLGDAAIFAGSFGDFIWNRSYYIALSFAAVVLTIIIYEKRRKGFGYGIKLQKNYKYKPAA